MTQWSVRDIIDKLICLRALRLKPKSYEKPTYSISAGYNEDVELSGNYYVCQWPKILSKKSYVTRCIYAASARS